jgi:hypothetical protein
MSVGCTVHRAFAPEGVISYAQVHKCHSENAAEYAVNFVNSPADQHRVRHPERTAYRRPASESVANRSALLVLMVFFCIGPAPSSGGRRLSSDIFISLRSGRVRALAGITKPAMAHVTHCLLRLSRLLTLRQPLRARVADIERAELFALPVHAHPH